MRLPPARTGPYVRALSTAVHALAPNLDYPPLEAIRGHLEALDPDVSGRLLAPAELMPQTGMPAFPWLERARAEAELARTDRERLRDEDELARAERLDPELGERLRWRRDLRRHLREHPVLPSSRVEGRARRLQRATEVLVSHDRIRPDGTWERVGLVLAAPAGRHDLGCARVGEGGRIDLDPGLLHLLARHADTPILALRAQVASVTEGRVRRVARGRVGPFWFPGVHLPDGVPAHLGQGLILHLALEVVGDEVRTSRDRDPLRPAPDLRPPEGHGWVRDRRFAVSGALAGPLGDWARERGVSPEIVVFTG